MDHIRMTRDGAVGFITIDRPERFNSLDVATAQDFRKAGLQLARDESVRCVVVRGVGKIFCSGADLKNIGAQGDDADLSYLQPAGAAPAAGVRNGTGPGYGEGFKHILAYLHSTIAVIKRAPKPFLAAVNGVAAAG